MKSRDKKLKQRVGRLKQRVDLSKSSFVIFFLCFVAVMSCGRKTESTEPAATDYTKVEIPAFSADSAYHYVKTQCDFGPRTPESKAAKLCGDYLIAFFKTHCDTVYVQEFESKLWDGKSVKGRNIIASFNPEATDRVLMGAHWDSRLWADNDPNPDNHTKPILGANDGASGVGVLMEIARVFKQKSCNLGLDIVLFDLEDQGAPQWVEDVVEDQSDWCLGSQHWAQHFHVPFYRAGYGILLDMVGTKSARFTKEAQSMYYASSIMNKVWDIASALGHSNVFVSEKTYPIMDDHVWVNQYAKIPMIDIVQNDPTCSFFPYWHTMGDDMSQIDKNVLKIVGDVCLTTIYSAQ